MELLSKAKFDFRQITSASGEDRPRSEILLDGAPTAAMVPGAILECALHWNRYYLVFATDDVPQEDTLHICLLDDRLRLLDHAKLGAMYSTGHFHDLRIAAANTVRFRFIGDTDWTVVLFDRPVFHLPLLMDPRGISRPLRFSTYMRLNGKPRVKAS